MQNVAESMMDVRDWRLEENERSSLSTFVTFNQRCKVMPVPMCKAVPAIRNPREPLRPPPNPLPTPSRPPLNSLKTPFGSPLVSSV